MNQPTLILDTSVIAKWFFPEEDSDTALIIKDKFANNTVSIAIPLLTYYEVNNILKTAVKSFRIDKEDALKAYHAFLTLNFVAYSSEDLMSRTLVKAIEFDISSYDASYLALAEYLEIPFLTADLKFLNKVNSQYIIKLADFDIKNDS